MLHLRPQVLVLVALSTAQVGCALSPSEQATYRDRDLDYQTAVRVEPIPLPAGLSERDAYQLPKPPAQLALNSTSEFKVPRPRALALGTTSSTQVAQDAQGPYLEIAWPPAQAWAWLQAYTQQQAWPILQAAPRQGRLDLGEGYSLQVQPSTKLDHSRVRWLHQGQVSTSTQVLETLAQYIQQQETMPSSASLLAQSLNRELQAQEIASLSGEVNLIQAASKDWQLVFKDFAPSQAWDRLDQVLAANFQQTEQQVTDKNRSQAWFQLYYVAQQAREFSIKNWLQGQFGTDDRGQAYWLSLQPSKAQGALQAQVYTDAQGQHLAPNEIQAEILTLLYQALR
ncbi:hypothetical protein SAMN05421831_11126 [Allopseudospirillum japonicum]|uniref:Outer membrane protein assembly factor BamC n=1 Tax=Allopseudospirillum japonicum TaxID=64971 RepID=A0A1H6TZQ5_9GAMM|nr:hypothetical protein [Allopseudospirillum japonicum]SEI81675.1 hypothetical protein SAMN05421831_11126 [Allopseudospirillum japonicum]